MARNLIRSGYDFARRFTLKRDGVAEDLSSATLIEASLVNEGKTSELIADTAQANSGDATWASGLVVVAFTAAQTAALVPGNAWIELAVVLAGVRLPYESIPVVIETGYAL